MKNERLPWSLNSNPENAPPSFFLHFVASAHTEFPKPTAECAAVQFFHIAIRALKLTEKSQSQDLQNDY